MSNNTQMVTSNKGRAVGEHWDSSTLNTNGDGCKIFSKNINEVHSRGQLVHPDFPQQRAPSTRARHPFAQNAHLTAQVSQPRHEDWCLQVRNRLGDLEDILTHTNTEISSNISHMPFAPRLFTGTLTSKKPKLSYQVYRTPYRDVESKSPWSVHFRG